MEHITKGDLKNFINKFGRKLPVVKQAITLFNVFADPKTPQYAKVIIAGALAYLVSPIDVIPDFTPIVGLVDDLAVITVAIAQITVHILPEHSQKDLE
jgi:uncharacterized membrane protein YkvA (DUF1232 family)